MHEQELLAVMHALREWRHHLLGQKFTVITDHHSLQYLQTQPSLSARQVRWSEFLQQFDYEITYRPGKENVVADALSRRPDHKLSAVRESVPIIDDTILDDIRRAYQSDRVAKQILEKGSTEYNVKDGMIYHKHRVYVPHDNTLRTRLLAEQHDTPTSGHLGEYKTLERLSRSFYWPNMRRIVRHYCRTCVSCQQNKSTNQLPAGLLQPLEIPDERWETVTMDFITKLPMTKSGHNMLIVFVDKLSKMIHCCPMTEGEGRSKAPVIAKLFFDNIVRLHGVPKRIVSDRDVRFTTNFWRELWRLLGTKLAMSTSYHPQTDGQTERANRTLEDIIRHYISFHHDDWDEHLTAAEIAINNSVAQSTGFSPYFINYGKHPRMPLTSILPTTTNDTVAKSLSQIADDIDTAKISIAQAQVRQQEFANKRRRDVVFQVGEEVWLSTKYLPVRDGVRKFTGKYAGPFKILKVHSPLSYKIDIPPEWKANRFHDVVHPSLLKRHIEASEFEDRPNDSHPPPPLEPMPEGEFVAEKIVKQRLSRNNPHSQFEHLVQWRDCDESENTWEPIQNFQDDDGTVTSQVLLDWQASNPVTVADQASLDIDEMLKDLQSDVQSARAADQPAATSFRLRRTTNGLQLRK